MHEKNEGLRLFCVFRVQIKFSASLRLCVSAFSYLHTALHTERSRNSGQYRRQRLKNEFPSFLFHKAPLHLPRGGEFLYSLRAITAEGIAGLSVNNELLSPFRKTN